jgi:hypothetical protein
VEGGERSAGRVSENRGAVPPGGAEVYGGRRGRGTAPAQPSAPCSCFRDVPRCTYARTCDRAPSTKSISERTIQRLVRISSATTHTTGDGTSTDVHCAQGPCVSVHAAHSVRPHALGDEHWPFLHRPVARPGRGRDRQDHARAWSRVPVLYRKNRDGIVDPIGTTSGDVLVSTVLRCTRPSTINLHPHFLHGWMRWCTIVSSADPALSLSCYLQQSNVNVNLHFEFNYSII